MAISSRARLRVSDFARNSLLLRNTSHDRLVSCALPSGPLIAQRILDTQSQYDILLRSGVFMRVAAFDHSQIRPTRHVRPRTRCAPSNSIKLRNHGDIRAASWESRVVQGTPKDVRNNRGAAGFGVDVEARFQSNDPIVSDHELRPMADASSQDGSVEPGAPYEHGRRYLGPFGQRRSEAARTHPLAWQPTEGERPRRDLTDRSRWRAGCAAILAWSCGRP